MQKKVGAVKTSTNLDVPIRNSRNVKDKHAYQPGKTLPQPTASTCCHCFTAVVGNDSISPMFVYASYFVMYSRLYYVITVLILLS